jgi:outer membrane receptor protein involved in Fe transport
MLALDALVVSGGLELSRRTLDRSARQADGSADLSALYREALDTRGAFAQARLRLGRVVLSAGMRTDHVSSLGVEAESPWAATAGASWSVPVGLTTVRLRGAWGRALRPPEPGMSQALAAGTIRQEANPALRAERQSGVELGAELHFASGAWLRLTWFDQRADDLVQQVDLRRPDGSTRFYQFQNVGAITNRGLELDGGVALGRFSAAARLHLVSSRVAQLASGYTGEFEPGDRPLEVPRSAASAAVRYQPGSSRIEVGVTWLGPWVGYDWQLVSRAEAGQVPVRDRAREYWLEYDGVLRPFVGARLPLAGPVAAWLRAEWPQGDAVVLRDNLSPTLGRTLLLGVEVGGR